MLTLLQERATKESPLSIHEIAIWTRMRVQVAWREVMQLWHAGKLQRTKDGWRAWKPYVYWPKVPKGKAA